MKATEVCGYAGKILRIDLSTGTVCIEPTTEYARKWLGGTGINQWILYQELKPWVTPYEPTNAIVIGAGPLVGTLVPGACRLSMASKNVFSGGVGTSSCGGHFAPELKFAGYDHIVLKGRARSPVYLWIDDEHIEFKDANSIWGKTTWETDDLIKQDIGDKDIQILCIGPAGENLVRGACVIANRNRAAGKCGLGAVMGSKNLKAIAVRGTGGVKVAQPDRFMGFVDGLCERLEKSTIIGRFANYGTHGIWPLKNQSCSVPYKNFQEAYVPEQSAKQIEPDIFLSKYKEKDIACAACPIHCSNFYRVNEGPYCGLSSEGFELETSVSFAGKLAIDYAPAIIKGHTLCNQLGLDVDNSTTTIAWAFECYQRGIITQQDTDGLKLEWGDYGVVFELLRKQAYRDGFGSILAEGCRHASDIIGRDSQYYAMTMKGQDLYEEIRLPVGWGLGTCVATRGGGHTTGAPGNEIFAALNPDFAEVAKRVFGVKTLDPTSYDDKPTLVVCTERLQELNNSLGICIFATAWLDPAQMSFEEIAGLYSAATGWEVKPDTLIKTADRILNLEKAFNVLHAGLGRKDDYPQERFLVEPIKTGPLKGFALSKEKYGEMLDEYYGIRGWDVISGLQTKKCLQTLDLMDVADDLENAKKIADICNNPGNG
jgi:aldehyde:ferredoxin oxidoreductase